jgi:hypothetical protein
MIELTQIDFPQAINSEGNKLLFIYSDNCIHCVNAENVINNSPNSTAVMLDEMFKCKMSECRNWCDDQGIDGTPALVLLNGDELISLINYAPDQDFFMAWIYNSIMI